jgi:copper chaperone NosL
MKIFACFLILSISLCACTIEPSAIIYGNDACDFCKMNIVDKQHAAQIVSSKGKAYKFDAIECMMNYMNRNEIHSESLAFILVCDYHQPGDLIDAKTATYIFSKNIPSPMGAFLSAVDGDKTAEQLLEIKEGELVDWKALKTRYKVID